MSHKIIYDPRHLAVATVQTIIQDCFTEAGTLSKAALERSLKAALRRGLVTADDVEAFVLAMGTEAVRELRAAGLIAQAVGDICRDHLSSQNRTTGTEQAQREAIHPEASRHEPTWEEVVAEAARHMLRQHNRGVVLIPLDEAMVQFGPSRRIQPSADMQSA